MASPALAWVKKELDAAPSVIPKRFDAFVSKLALAERQSRERLEPELGFLGIAPPPAPTPRRDHRPTSPASLSSRHTLGGGRMASLDSRFS